MDSRVPAMQARLRALEFRRGEILKENEDLKRELDEIDRDCRILALAIDPEPEETPEPAPAGKVN